jgi:hypothetical protein
LRLLTSLDVFAFMNMALLIAGPIKVCGKLSVKIASMMVIEPWTVYLGVTIAIKVLMSLG